MDKRDGQAFDRLLKAFHEAFQDSKELSPQRKRAYWDALVGYSFDRVALGFQASFTVGKYRGLPLPAEIITNMPSVPALPKPYDDGEPDTADEFARKLRFTQWCIAVKWPQWDGPTWRRNYIKYCESNGDGLVKQSLKREGPGFKGMFDRLKRVDLNHVFPAGEDGR